MPRQEHQGGIISPAGPLRPLAVVGLIGCIRSDKCQLCSKWDSRRSRLVDEDLSDSDAQIRLRFVPTSLYSLYTIGERCSWLLLLKTAVFIPMKQYWTLLFISPLRPSLFREAGLPSALVRQIKLNKHAFNLHLSPPIKALVKCAASCQPCITSSCWATFVIW